MWGGHEVTKYCSLSCFWIWLFLSKSFIGMMNGKGSRRMMQIRYKTADIDESITSSIEYQVNIRTARFSTYFHEYRSFQGRRVSAKSFIGEILQSCGLQSTTESSQQYCTVIGSEVFVDDDGICIVFRISFLIIFFFFFYFYFDFR